MTRLILELGTPRNTEQSNAASQYISEFHSIGMTSRRVVVVLQARTNSSRLPGKALLPLGGHESAVLAALRAKNTGHNVILATSNQTSDDALAECAKHEGIEVLRGDLDDVRSRFTTVSDSLIGDDVLVRLTGDNVFPDGDFINLAVEALLSSGHSIVRSMEDPRLPYGLAVEAFSVAAFRASLMDSSAGASEHVTPPLIQRQSTFLSFVPIDKDLSALRCTLDTEADYQLLRAVFSGVCDPVSVGWRELVRRLIAVSMQRGRCQ